MPWNHKKGMEIMLVVLKTIGWLAGFFLGVWLAPFLILLILTGNWVTSTVVGLLISIALSSYWYGATQLQGDSDSE